MVRLIKGNFPPEKVKELVTHTTRAICGLEPDRYRIAERFWSSVAYSLFESIFTAFLTKSRHETDELGQSWKDLDPKTKAYNRPDARSALALYDNRAVRHPHLKVRPTLPPNINKQWGGRWLGIYMNLFGATGEEGKAAAGGSTWDYFKAKGYPTLIGLTHDMRLPILNKTGALQRSLFPAPLSGGFYMPIDPNQIFRIQGSKLSIGTKRPGVSHVDKTRPLWPRDTSKWRAKALEAGRETLYEQIPILLTQL